MSTSKNYSRLMLGGKSVHAETCYQGGFVGVDFGMDIDFAGQLVEDWREFNKRYIPIFLENRPDKTKIAAGLACGAIHAVCKGINQGHIVLCPDGSGSYLVGEIVSGYSYHAGEILPHRRAVTWYPNRLERSAMSQPLQRSTGSIGTVSNISKHAEELEQLLGGNAPLALVVTDSTVEDPTVFALEKYLEAFLIANWGKTSLGKRYDIFEDEGELVGQQYPSDTGPIDILAISKDKKELLVVELKKGRASDAVVGQIQRYMGYVMGDLAEEGQTVRGVIVALEKDLRLQRALSVTQNIDFYRYQVDFKLFQE
jgi:restriction system protein